jgi:hypothetical protein
MGEGPPIQRRLAAILAADIAGYSRLMHEDLARETAGDGFCRPVGPGSGTLLPTRR